MKTRNRGTLTLAFLAGALTAAIACGSSPAAPTFSETVHAQGAPEVGYSFASGAGMTEQRDWLFIRPGGGQQYGPVGIAGQVHLTSLEGSGTRYVCVDGSNRIYASTTACR
jgi:hypothetical protein